ncbi:response regulator transcription factor (plasmid) [Niallia taxi]|uniref:Response regulator transcription factor n=4 Tax=Bacteria TaxID=2 RepID=A0A3S2U885_9BACI|nr:MULTISPECIES: response regulator transcription factor [Niallia]MDK8643706.1 response regulator transcription factor [Niallia taxi]MED4057666.1 response regulator transcription factor [Niallia taxi]RVT59462.1 response regulator transcription factor [Niallia taxi]UPO91362.1 response regulator transcription factor [Niallia sp. Man26]
MMKKILIIGGDKGYYWFKLLKRYGFDCIEPVNPKDMINSIISQNITMVLIDNSSLKLKVEDICKEIRVVSSVFLVVISNNTNDSLVSILKNGADICLKEPIYEEELLARINSLFRTLPKVKSEVYTFNHLQLEKSKHELTYNKKLIPLSQIEIKIIELLINNPNKVLTPSSLIKSIWTHNPISQQTLRSYIRNIRDKIRETGFPIDKHLETIWGVGYIWKQDG